MSKFVFSKRSLQNLSEVHPDLQKVITLALDYTDCDFVVIDGMRTQAEQNVLFAKGKSRTLNSRHLTGHAVDLAAYITGNISWEPSLYTRISRAVFRASNELSVPIEWGGNWVFHDLGHFQLPRDKYPEMKEAA